MDRGRFKSLSLLEQCISINITEFGNHIGVFEKRALKVIGHSSGETVYLKFILEYFI